MLRSEAPTGEPVGHSLTTSVGYAALAALGGLAAVVLSDATAGGSWLVAPVLAGSAAAFIEWRTASDRSRIQTVGIFVGVAAFGASLLWLVVVVLAFGAA
jgi:hypothetical protein